jgi:predicted PurR-regulated permease PerM
MSSSNELVPRPLAVAAAWSWRLVVVIFAIVTVAITLFQLRIVTVPFFVAILFTTVLVPPAKFLERRGFKSALSVLATFFFAIAAVAAMVYLLASPVTEQLKDLGPQVEKGVEDVNDWLKTGPLELTDADIDRYYEQALESAKSNSGSLGSGFAHGATIAFEVITGILVTIILTIFLTKDGENLFKWWVGLLPERHRDKADRVGKRAWHALGGYLRGVAFTGIVDAVLIGVWLAILGVPLVLPLMLLTFFGAFLPVVGATLAGLVAVLIALVNGGGTDALLVLLGVIVVQQIEGHVLQPVVMSRAVSVHPIVILMSLAVGALLAGIIGAFLAVPLVAVTSAALRELYGNDSPIPIDAETQNR